VGALSRKDHLTSFGVNSASSFAAPWCLAAGRVGTAPWCYEVVLIDPEGIETFHQTLVFDLLSQSESRALEREMVLARPNERTADALADLAALCADRSVCVLDELTADLDGLRQPLCEARRVHSLLPTLAQALQGAGAAEAARMFSALDTAFSDPPSLVRLADFIRRGCLWSAAPSSLSPP